MLGQCPSPKPSPIPAEVGILKYGDSTVTKMLSSPAAPPEKTGEEARSMVNLASVRVSNAHIKLTAPLVAVLVGGTSGIGRATLLELATIASRGKGLKVYIVTRHASSQHDLIDALRIASGDRSTTFNLLEGQASLLGDVHRLCDEIAQYEESIDMLWLSAGDFPISGRVDTVEDLSRTITINYWGRMLFVERLLPRLRASAVKGHAPRIVALGSPGREIAELDADDLDSRAPDRYPSR